MKRQCFIKISSIIFILFLISCTSVVYKYGNQSYDTPEPALEAQKKELNSILSKITETKNPLDYTAIVILPNNTYIGKNFIVLRGSESAETKEKKVKFLTEILINSLKEQCKAIEKRKIFKRVVVSASNDPPKASFDDDIMIGFFNNDGKEKWFMKRKKDNPMNLIEIEEITTALPPFQRTILWLDKIENAAKGN
jgi:hypothetical protein